MAPAPEAPSRGGFSLSKPGAKEYLIVGGVTLAAALLYFWWKNRTASTAAAATTPATDGTTAPATPTGLSTGQFLAWVQDHASSSTSTTPDKVKTASGVVPHVVGKPGEEAADAIQGAGFRPLQTPPGTPKGKRTIVTSQNPSGGRHMAKGAPVAYAVRVDQGARTS